MCLEFLETCFCLSLRFLLLPWFQFRISLFFVIFHLAFKLSISWLTNLFRFAISEYTWSSFEREKIVALLQTELLQWCRVHFHLSCWLQVFGSSTAASMTRSLPPRLYSCFWWSPIPLTTKVLHFSAHESLLTTTTILTKHAKQEKTWDRRWRLLSSRSSVTACNYFLMVSPH